VHLIGEDVLVRRHCDYYLELADRFHADWFGPRQAEWTRLMRAELANLRAAMDLSVHDAERRQAGVRLAGALYYFWYGCGEVREGRYWLERVLAADPGQTPHRAWALAALARMHILQGRPDAALAPAGEALRLAERFAEPFTISHALHSLGLSLTFTGDPAGGRARLEQARQRAAELGATHPAVAFTAFALGAAAMLRGDALRAAELYAESRAISRAHGEQWWSGIVLTAAVIPALQLGDLTQARRFARESLRARGALHDTHGAASSVEFLAFVAAAAQDHRRAARLLGAADRHWRAVGGSPFAAGPWRRFHNEYEADVRQALGAAGFAAEYRRGGEMALDEAVAYALGRDRAGAVREPAATDNGPRLTPREVEIAELVGQGLSNRQIAEHLVISLRTAESHVENILAKFGFTSRAQVAAWYAGRSNHRPPASS
jgi:ATP/maltotriose-dependent transcriptional regulator MalT